MKITKLSLAAVAVMGLVGVTNADVDLKVGGQAVLYYQTMDKGGDADLFDHDTNSFANTGLQLNVNADLGNDFGLGYQETFLGTLGLEKNLVGNVMQKAGEKLNDHGMTKLYVTKKLANTTFKLGRQELPKSLSPLAFSEGWNVFKNTFDAAVAINTDIPDTTLVGAYVARSNTHANLASFNDMAAGALPSGAYMLTVANKSIKELPATLTYYSLPDLTGGEEGSAIWADVKADFGLPVKVAIQGGQITPENNLEDTTAFGAKVSGKAGLANLFVAYSTVDDGALAVKNVGTNVKTPLYTQMVLNQDHISSDADTIVVGGSVPVGPGTLIAKYNSTTDNSSAGTDYQELDILYKAKVLGMDTLVAYVMSDHDVNGQDPNNIIRVWGRYNF